MRNALGFTKDRDIDPWPSDYSLTTDLEGNDKWREYFHSLYEYMWLEVDPGLHLYILQYPDFEGNPFVSDQNDEFEDEITVLNPNIVSVLNFETGELGVYIAHGYWHALFSALRHSAAWILYVKYGIELGYKSASSVPDIDKKFAGAKSFLANEIDLPLSREEVLDNTTADYTPINMNEELPWIPNNTGDEKILYTTGWTKEEVYEAREKVKEIQKESSEYGYNNY